MKQKTHQPDSLSISIDQFIGASFAVRWKDSKLLLSQSEVGPARYEEPTACSPSPLQWQSFWSQAGNCGVWYWQRHYDNVEILDGTQWEVNLVHADKQITSSGSNSFPPQRNNYPSEAFRQFLRALGGLMDNRAFVERWYDQFR